MQSKIVTHDTQAQRFVGCSHHRLQRRQHEKVTEALKWRRSPSLYNFLRNLHAQWLKGVRFIHPTQHAFCRRIDVQPGHLRQRNQQWRQCLIDLFSHMPDQTQLTDTAEQIIGWLIRWLLATVVQRLSPTKTDGCVIGIKPVYYRLGQRDCLLLTERALLDRLQQTDELLLIGTESLRRLQPQIVQS